MSWVIQKMLLSAQNNWLYVCCDTVSVHVQVWSDNLAHYSPILLKLDGEDKRL